MSRTAQDTRIGVTALTGFLGSGKTTLLNRSLARPGLGRSLVVVNELGEIGVDHHLIKVLQEDVVLLPGGCVCCSLRGGLADTLRDRFMLALQGRGERFDRVLIETSGVADPSPILFTLRHDPFLSQRYRYDHTLTVADATHVLEQLERHPEVVRQLALADTLAISKTDLCDADRRARVQAALMSINPIAAQFEIAATRTVPQELRDRLGPASPASRTDPTDSTDSMSRTSSISSMRRLTSDGDHSAQPDGGGEGDVPLQWQNWSQRLTRLSAGRHTAGVSSFIVPLPLALPRSRLYAAIEGFQADFGPQLLRMKGLADLAGQRGPAVVHAVHGQLYPLGQLAGWPGKSPDPSLVCVMHGDQADRAEKAFRGFFES